MHSLILSGFHQDTEPVKTAEEVIREIDDMMQVLAGQPVVVRVAVQYLSACENYFLIYTNSIMLLN
jgi:hypothetical protein